MIFKMNQPNFVSISQMLQRIIYENNHEKLVSEQY